MVIAHPSGAKSLLAQCRPQRSDLHRRGDARKYLDRGGDGGRAELVETLSATNLDHDEAALEQRDRCSLAVLAAIPAPAASSLAGCGYPSRSETSIDALAGSPMSAATAAMSVSAATPGECHTNTEEVEIVLTTRVANCGHGISPLARWFAVIDGMQGGSEG
jgi:hypothetical protein